MFERIFKWMDHNRFVVVFPLVALALWFAGGCLEPRTASPLDARALLDAPGLELAFTAWQAEVEIMAAKFTAAGADLETQRENIGKLKEFVLSLATGGVADLPSLVQLLITGGGIGAITDNIRKRGLISGLKRNNKNG